jgi:hypothetical protein
MQTEWTPDRNSAYLSVRIVSGILFWGSLTVLTLVAQALGIPFKLYFRAALILIAALLAAAIARARGSLSRPRSAEHENDALVLAGLVVLCLAAAALSLMYHTTGRVYLDDFYLVANPVYYTQHAQAAMSFEARTFYSGGLPVISIAFLTADAYEHILSIPAYLLKIDYVTVYYRLAAVLNAALLVLSLFYTLAHFTRDTKAALGGTAAVLCLLATMSENSWAIGNWAFLHGYEGRAILIMDGIPLLAAFSLDVLGRPTRRTWLQLFLFVTAMTGMSTSSFMILPLLGIILFLAWGMANRAQYPSVIAWAKSGGTYFSAFTYLIFFAALVSLVDKAGNAPVFNLDYPDNFYGYLQAFLASSAWPATVALSLLSWIAAVLVARGRMRAFLGAWFALAIILFLNPLSARLLLMLFRGIYFRLFYVVFHPLFGGVAAAWLAASACILLLPAALSPTSLFLSPRYSFGNWTPTDDYAPAQKIVNNAPEGLMLAPYPLSGAVRMISSNHPQIEARSDILSFYLGLQGRAEEAALRVRANDFLTGTATDFPAFERVVERYSELRSVVFSRSGLAEVNSPAVDQFLKDKGFVHHQGVEKYVVYWR